MRPLKTLKRILLVLTALLVIAAIILYFTLNGIIKRTISTQATDSLSLQTDVGGVAINLFTGSFGLLNLTIASPPGFQASHMLSLGQGGVGVSYGRLRGQTVHLDSLTLTKPQIVVEQVNGKFNFQVLTNLPPRTSTEPMKLIIDKLTVTDATVIIRPGIPGLDASMKEIIIPIPGLELKNIGNADGNENGAAIKEVAIMLITSLVEKAQQSGNLPKQLQNALAQGVKGVETQLKNEVDKQLKGIDKSLIRAGLPGIGSEIGKAIDIGDKNKSKDSGKKK